MAVIKIVLLFTVTLAVSANMKDLQLKSTKRDFLAELVEIPKETKAIVVDSNLSSTEANSLAVELQYIYNSVAGALNRAAAFQDQLNRKYPSLRNNVIINAQTAAYYQRYYLIISVNGDLVLSFGL